MEAIIERPLPLNAPHPHLPCLPSSPTTPSLLFVEKKHPKLEIDHNNNKYVKHKNNIKEIKLNNI